MSRRGNSNDGGCLARIIAFLIFIFLCGIISVILPYIILIVIVILIFFSLILYFASKKERKINNNYTSYSNTNYNDKLYDLDVENESDDEELSWGEEEFEREADLWGLSQEDRKIAKEERMSPADFIEAEERDDDELFTDEWEN